MEQRNLLLQGIAAALNAFGSALVSIYDLTASTLGNVLPGEKEKLKGKIREYEQKIERLYSEVGKEVSKEGDMARLSAAGEAGLNRIAEYRIEIEKIKQSIQAIEEAERQKKEEVLQKKESAPMMKSREAEEPVIVSQESAPEEKIEKEAEPEVMAEPSQTDRGVAGEPSAGIEREAEKEAWTEEAQPPVEMFPLDTSGPEIPETGETSPGLETEAEKEALPETPETQKEPLPEYTPEMLGNKLKGDLLALCTEKGIEADKSMTKAEIIQLLMRRS